MPNNEKETMIEIIERQVVGKKSQEECEDGIVATDDFVAVIDGSTSKTDKQFCPTMRNGRYAMTLVAELIKQQLSAEDSVETFCRKATQRIQQCYQACKADMERLKANPVERMTCSSVVYSAARREIWFVGDCQALDCTHGKLYENSKPYEQPIAEMRSARIRLDLLDGANAAEYRIKDKGRDFILPLLREYCKYQNVTYPVIDGFDIPMDTVKVVDLPASTQEIVLASDGYPFLAKTLGESEERLAHLLEEDPLLIDKVKMTKGWMKGNRSFDDRAYVRFRL